MDHSFNINYILEYKYNNKIEKELDYIKMFGEEEFIKDKTVYSLTNKNDLISPIFTDDNIIGYCYKYYPNPDYSHCFIYQNYLSNEKLIKVFKLYKYNKDILKKIREINYIQKERLFLINKDLALKIKKDYNYEEFRKKLEENISHPNAKNVIISYNKILLSIIKNMTSDEFNFFFNKNPLINYEKSLMEPFIIPLNKNEQRNQIMIYDNFEIFNESAIIHFIDGITGKESNYLECYLNEGKIIINYPFDMFGNKRYVCILGSLNEENTFIKEYILIYNDYYDHINHMKKMNGKIINYLSSLQLYNNSQPIINDSYEEVGIIIKVGNKNEDINYNYNQFININNNNSNFSKITINYGKEPLDRYENSANNWEKNYNNDLNNDSYHISEFEYNLDYKTDTPLINAHFPFPPLVGLKNIGATCYMNATLQCFCHIEGFINFFKYSHQPINIAKIDKNKLTSSFKLLIEKLWPNNVNTFSSKRYYAPEEFKNKISKMNPLFKGVAANDAKDLVNFIIMTLHEELNKVKEININYCNSISLDQSNPQLMFNYFSQNFVKQNQSIISDLFYGVNCNITNCNECGMKTYNYQTYFFIVFPLEEVRKFVCGNQMNNYYFNNNTVNIYNCFDYDKKINILDGANTMYCNYCKRTCSNSMCTILTTGPEILILLLNRGKGIEFNVKINFVDNLDLSNYISYSNTGCKYKLIGVITHMGESGMGGHFIAYCLDPISKNWYKYNDEIVSQVEDFQKEVIDYAMPYLLFYQKNQ